jgi:DNA-binding transcriptional LysR family regulator
MSNLSQIYDLDLKLLRCFCTIVDEGGFSGAQAVLNISQSMLSEHLRTLEVRLGTRLCRRGPKGFKLFPEGEVVYRAAQELFTSVELFKQRASNMNEGMGYELVIGIQDGIVENPHSRISEAIERFSQYYPNVRFKVEIMLGFQMIGRVADGLIHVGIGLLHDRFQHLSFEHLFDEPAAIYCGRQHCLFGMPEKKITRKQIESVPHSNRGHLEYFFPDHLQIAIRGDVGYGAQAHLALILSGRNIGYLPDHIAKPYVETGQLRVLRPDLTRLVNPIVAFMRPGPAEFKLTPCLVDCLVDVHMERPKNRPPMQAAVGVELKEDAMMRSPSSAPITANPDRPRAQHRY